MAEQIPFWIALLVIFGIITILGLAMLALFYLISTRTTNRYLRLIAPVIVILLGVSSVVYYSAGSVFATSALVAAPVAAFIATFLVSGFEEPKAGIWHIVLCDLIVSLFGAGIALYSVMDGFPGVPWISALAPAANGVVFLAWLVVDLLLATGIYTGLERAGYPGNGEGNTGSRSGNS